MFGKKKKRKRVLKAKYRKAKPARKSRPVKKPAYVMDDYDDIEIYEDELVDDELYDENSEEYYEDEAYEEDFEEYYEDEEYEEDSEEYYENEEYEEDSEEYYEDEAYEENSEEYYEDEAYKEDSEEYYEDEEYEEDSEEYYEDEEYEEDFEGYYEDEAYDEDDEYYEQEQGFFEYDAYEKPKKRRRKKVKKSRKASAKGKAVKAKKRKKTMTFADQMIAIVGVVVLIVALITSSIYVNARMLQKQIDSFASVGAAMNGVGIVGESGLLAVSNAVLEQEELARQAELEAIEAAEEEEEEQAEIKEEAIQLALKLTTIQSDIKIKIINEKTGKLVGGIPFKATVTGDNGKTYNWEDKDKDGIMYHIEVPNGTYTVTLDPLSGSEAEQYKMPNIKSSVTVTDKIAYKKVDVQEEIKTEAQVNAAVEDTKVQETVQESENTDTVEWVESTKSSTQEEGYEKVPKSDIVDPSTLARLSGFVKLVEVSLEKGADTTLKPNAEGTVTWQSGDANIATVDTNGKVVGVGSGKATITASIVTQTGTVTESWTVAVSEKVSDSSGTTDTTTPQIVFAELSPTSLKIEKGKTGSLSAKVTPAETVVSYSSNNTAVATVDSAGVVTGVAKGNAVITATAGGESKSCSVEVTEQIVPVTLDKTTMEVVAGANSKLTATGNNVSFQSDKTDVATVDGSGLVTGIKEGTATITATDGNTKATCTVTVKAKPVPTIQLDQSNVSIKVKDKITLKAKLGNNGSNTKVIFQSDKTDIATVDGSGVVTGVKAGTATITATLEGTEAKASCTVTVITSVDMSAPLKDKNGNQMYYKNADGKYIAATNADYSKYDEFYKKINKETNCTYTGWQTIDGSTYFFDKNGNYVTGEQVIQGAKYTFGSDGRLSAGSGTLGIDVSKWNGNIDWKAVKNSGVSYAIIRCGYRGSTTGALIEDPKYRTNIKNAKAAGLNVGVYFFCQAVNEVEAVEEASMVLSLISGMGVNLPVYLDVESSGGRGDHIDKATRTAVCKAFCQTIQNSGYTAGIYANKEWFTNYINTSSLTNFKIWLAQYASAPTYTATRYDMWQYSSKGSVNGISGNVDMNIKYN